MRRYWFYIAMLVVVIFITSCSTNVSEQNESIEAIPIEDFESTDSANENRTVDYTSKDTSKESPQAEAIGTKLVKKEACSVISNGEKIT